MKWFAKLERKFGRYAIRGTHAVCGGDQYSGNPSGAF